MTKPIRHEHFNRCVEWWGGPKREGRVETEFTWRVTAEEVKERGYNLDFKNPHCLPDDHGDPKELLKRLDEAEQKAALLRNQLKSILEEALLR
jgi:type I restriction enzyme M protein